MNQPNAQPGFVNLFVGRRGKILLIVTLAVMICLSMASFAFRFYTLDQGAAKVAQLERSLNNLKATLNADAKRQFQIQKTIALIEKYNSAMATATQYEIADEIGQMAIKYPNLNVNLICAIITHESGLTWRPDVRSQTGGIGLMQIMPATGVFLAADEGVPWTSPEEVLCNPILNIRLGCRYLSTLISLYELEGGLAAFHGGEKRAALWLHRGKNDDGLTDETRQYLNEVLKLYEQFQG